MRRILTTTVFLLFLWACGSTDDGTRPDRVTLRFSYDAAQSDQRSIALIEQFAPAVADFANFEPHWNASLFRQGTELVALARGNLDMTITSAQEIAEFVPEFSIFTAGYVHRDASHQVAVFNDPFMDTYKTKVEEVLGVKLLSVMYLGRRQLNLRTEQKISTPDDLSGINLRMPGSSSWQFLGRALGASPTPMAFSEVYTALQTGAIDGQDNPLPTVMYSKFYEVTRQIVLTSHLVDLNYLVISKTAWDSLTTEQQRAVERAAVRTADYGRREQLALEAELVDFFREQGLNVYEPDIAAFRQQVQRAYLDSEYASSWPKGALDRINAL